MGKDKRLWRKLVKKLRRKKKRQIQAQTNAPHDEISVGEVRDEKKSDNDHNDTSDLHFNGMVELGSDFFLSPDEWEYREKQAELEATMKRIETEKLANIEAENQRKIREEWDAKQEHERMLKEERERLEKQMKEKQEAEFNELLSFLSGDIETPPTNYLLPDTILDEENVCYYFTKTAACRFYERCTKLHPRPTLSTAILIPNFFSHFKLEQSTRDEYDTDLGLEYEDQELQKEFIEFYDDVVPELRKYGTLVQFKVCCNLEPHLRGNVYVQYRTIQEAVEAYRKFNGRFYNGRQLSLQFIKMDSWRSAICGSFLRKACIKGRTCSFLHVFRNPTKEFVKADHDWKDTQTHRGPSSSSSLAQNVPSTTPPQELNLHLQDNSKVKSLPSCSANGEKHCEQQHLKEKCTIELNQRSENVIEKTKCNQAVCAEPGISTSASHKTKRSRSSLSVSKKCKKAKKEKKLKKTKSKHKKKKKKKRKHSKLDRSN